MAAAASSDGDGGGGGGNVTPELEAGEPVFATVMDPRAPLVQDNGDVTTPFVEMFRNSAPYISMHRWVGRVVGLGGV